MIMIKSSTKISISQQDLYHDNSMLHFLSLNVSHTSFGFTNAVKPTDSDLRDPMSNSPDFILFDY